MKIAILASAVALVVATPAAAESWQSFSRTSSTVYLIEVDSIVAEGEVTSLRMATVPRGLSRSRSAAMASRTFSWRVSMRRMFSSGFMQIKRRMSCAYK